jgi:hypothetical protein
MNDTITVEVDGELGEPDYLPDRPRPAWGMPAAALVIVLLLGGLGWTLLSGGGSTREPAATPTPTVVPTTTPTTAPPVSSSTTAPQPAVEEPVYDLTDPVQAAQAALDAWGEFAVSGDLTVLEPFFDPASPQYAQLEAEAADARGGIAYEVTAEEPEVVVDGEIARVEATVTWRRVGEPDQRYEWSIELRRAGEAWRLWTVRTV